MRATSPLTPATVVVLLATVTIRAAEGQSVELPALLDVHNWHRSTHGAEPLVWDSELEKDAWSWAEYLTSGCSIFHSSDGEYGENIYMCSSTDQGCASGNNSAVAVDDPIAGWYESEKDWSPLAPSHFTQVVWKSSQRVGCGVARCAQDEAFVSEIVVCKYSPPGNVAGQYEDNVMPAAAPSVGK